mmetsp:Transcript_16705/g.28742  ORF Transcript_16705/g.28742 Transcript_16705/m.28742 type:complete len:156 (-) Transcript_16705:456-923(-)
MSGEEGITLDFISPWMCLSLRRIFISSKPRKLYAFVQVMASNTRTRSTHIHYNLIKYENMMVFPHSVEGFVTDQEASFTAQKSMVSAERTLETWKTVYQEKTAFHCFMLPHSHAAALFSQSCRAKKNKVFQRVELPNHISSLCILPLACHGLQEQ